MANHLIGPIMVDGNAECVKHGDSTYTRAAPWRTVGVLDNFTLTTTENADEWELDGALSTIGSVIFGVSCLSSITVRFTMTGTSSGDAATCKLYLDNVEVISDILTHGGTVTANLTVSPPPDTPCGRIVTIYCDGSIMYGGTVEMSVTAVT